MGAKHIAVLPDDNGGSTDWKGQCLQWTGRNLWDTQGSSAGPDGIAGVHPPRPEEQTQKSLEHWAMIEHFADLVNQDDRLVERGRHISLTFLLGVGDAHWLVEINQGRIEAVRPKPVLMPVYRFAICCAAEHWAEFWQPQPKPSWQDIFGLQRHHGLTLEGDLQPLIANLFWFKDVLETPRKISAGASAGAAA